MGANRMLPLCLKDEKTMKYPLIKIKCTKCKREFTMVRWRPEYVIRCPYEKDGEKCDQLLIIE